MATEGTKKSAFLKLGIVGWPLGYSLSPLMHEAALKAAGLEGEYKECPIKPNSRGESVYELADVSDLEDGIRKWLEKDKLLDGFNVTMPFKSKAYVWVTQNGQIADAPGSIAHATHVINTVRMEGGIPKGYNTDREGFLLPLKGIDLSGASVVLLGAGGASRTIAAALGLNAKVRKITFFNRSLENAEITKRDLQTAFNFNDCKVDLEISNSLESLPIEECKLLVNATPMGQQGENDVPNEMLNRLQRNQYVYDIVYSPRDTALVRAARTRGGDDHVITGDQMLAGQGAAAFEIWTDVPAQRVLPVMKKALDEHLARASRS